MWAQQSSVRSALRTLDSSELDRLLVDPPKALDSLSDQTPYEQYAMLEQLKQCSFRRVLQLKQLMWQVDLRLPEAQERYNVAQRQIQWEHNATVSFLQFPLDIRLEIYKLYLAPVLNLVIDQGISANRDKYGRLALFRVNRLVYEEASRSMWQNIKVTLAEVSRAFVYPCDLPKRKKATNDLKMPSYSAHYNYITIPPKLFDTVRELTLKYSYRLGHDGIKRRSTWQDTQSSEARRASEYFAALLSGKRNIARLDIDVVLPEQMLVRADSAASLVTVFRDTLRPFHHMHLSESFQCQR